MWFFSPYRPDIQQGNFVSEEMLAQLKVGMTQDQVRFIFGTALLKIRSTATAGITVPPGQGQRRAPPAA
jgi:hypothetical protein